MSLFEGEESDETDFPTLPAFTVKVEVRPVPSMGEDQKGVFALEDLPVNTKIWKWTDRVQVIPGKDLPAYIEKNFQKDADNVDAIRIFLRQGFVLPATEDNPSAEENFNSNPKDAGRFMNHSAIDPTCGPDGTLRDVKAGEELTMDYNFHGDPEWYQAICRKYGVLTERQVANAVASKVENINAPPVS